MAWDEQACRQVIRDWLYERQRKAAVLAQAPDASYVLNSVDFMELLLMIEQRFDVYLNPFDISPTELATPQQIAALVSARMQA